MIGFKIDGKHTWHTFRCRIAKRQIGCPKKNRITDTAAYSNAVYNFSGLYGQQTYGERTLSYQLVFEEDAPLKAQERIRDITAWLSYCGYRVLYDDMTPGYYYQAEAMEPKVTEQNCLYIIDVEFKAAPYQIPTSPSTPYTGTYPDINGDGTVDANDVSLVLTAAAQLGAGNPSGLTAEQEALADTNGDGSIDANDANYILAFAAATGVGTYTNDQAGWAKFMNEKLAQEEGVI